MVHCLDSKRSLAKDCPSPIRSGVYPSVPQGPRCERLLGRARETEQDRTSSGGGSGKGRLLRTLRGSWGTLRDRSEGDQKNRKGPSCEWPLRGRSQVPFPCVPPHTQPSLAANTCQGHHPKSTTAMPSPAWQQHQQGRSFGYTRRSQQAAASI